MAAAKKKTTIAKATVTLKGGQKKKITVKLNAKGRRLLKKQAQGDPDRDAVSERQEAQDTILKKNLRFKR